jgi:hypothetical protein
VLPILREWGRMWYYEASSIIAGDAEARGIKLRVESGG